MSGPLSGIRILDLTTFQAGPQGTTVMAELGADVIKVEKTNGGDEGRVLYCIGPMDRRESVFFYICNRGKRSISLDLKRPEAIAVVDRLVTQVDVIANNFRPGVMERLNLSYERLRKINSRLIYVSVTGWGKRGPKAAHPAFDTAAQARGGLVWQTGEQGGFPVPAGAAVADHSGALNLAIAVLAGIVARERTGEGQEIDLSLFRSVLGMQAAELTYSLLSGKQIPRAGRGHPLFPALTRIFQTSDGYLGVLGVEDGRWPGFCRAVVRPDLEHDERFKNTRKRRHNMEALYAELDPVFTAKTTAEWIERLEAEDQPCSPVQTYQDLASDPVAAANNYVVEVDHPRFGKGKVVGPPFEFHGTSLRSDVVEPTLGQHTREVLLGAGFAKEEIDSLIASGVAFETDPEAKSIKHKA